MKRLGRIGLLLITNIAVIVLVGAIIAALEYFFGINITASLGQGRWGLLIFAGLFGMGGAFVNLWISIWVVKRVYKLKQIGPNARDARLVRAYETVARIARDAGIKTPGLYIYASEDANAFATGPSRNKSIVALSTALIAKLTPQELDAVIGHEMGHIVNGDMITMTLLQGVINTFVIFLSRVVAQLIDGFLSRDGEGGLGILAYYALVTILDMIFGVAGALVIAGYSRRREFHADTAGARFTDRMSMISALKTISSRNKQSRSFVQDEFAALKFSGPQGRKRRFSTHPSMEARIKHLQEADLLK